ncbi:cyclin-dependent kinase 9-like isoform X2 [Nasonia vitripennis]|nr:cyclin-dependent kinase 9-like isoform X2 [Nasonia vitripennis]
MLIIGEGTFGKVFKARNKHTEKFVALKLIMVFNEEGFPMTAIREIKILQRLDHVNIVHLIEICKSRGSPENYFKANFFLVMEFCEHDLAAFLLNKNVTLKLEEIKMMLKMMLNGLFYLHSNKILHRDLKPANILLTRTGILKLADFGLARPFSTSTAAKRNCMTVKVVTLWYRAPELHLGDRDYGPPIDLWSAGCIMAELWTRRPLMIADSEQMHLQMISGLCGSINTEVWPDVNKLPLFKVVKLPQHCDRKICKLLRPRINNDKALDLLDKLLILDPKKRIDANDALDHEFLWTNPLPCDLSPLMRQYDRSNFSIIYNRR